MSLSPPNCVINPNYNGIYYLPQPERVWSRRQNQCTFLNNLSNLDYNNFVFNPYLKRNISLSENEYYNRQFYKGNVLQYKANSANFTKKQKYSKLANMCGPKRTKTFATQTQTYTNPNTNGYLRVASTFYDYNNNIVGAPNNPSGPFTYNLPNPDGCSTKIIEDGGNLIGTVITNPCTGEIIKSCPDSSTFIFPVNFSNVPGTGFLYWNNNINTFYPRQNLTNNNSSNKFPFNYKGFQSGVKPNPPVLNYSYNGSNIFISWTYYSNNSCLPLSSFNIYINNLLFINLPADINSYNISNNNLINGNNTIFVTSLSNNIESCPSNIVYFTYP